LKKIVGTGVNTFREQKPIEVIIKLSGKITHYVQR